MMSAVSRPGVRPVEGNVPEVPVSAGRSPESNNLITSVRAPAPELDHELRPLAEALPDLTLDDATLPTLRDMLADMVLPAEASPGVTRTDHVVDELTGVVVRVHRPTQVSGGRPCVYSMHGGGYVLGNRSMDDERLDRWCSRFGCVGVSVEYRLAPEHPFPAAHEDCLAGLTWVLAHAGELGVDPGRVGLAGISAGGGLAAALALVARDRGLQVRFVVLEAPMLDDRQITASSQYDDLVIWSRESNSFGWRAYLAGLDSDVPYAAAPARADDLRGLPPTFICVGGADGFRDENIEYALRLGQAGVPTELHVYPGAPHGFELFGDIGIAQQANHDIEQWVERQLRQVA
jgi:acetyl esterase/lipase